MNDLLFWVGGLGLALLAEALLARHEVLAYGAGWRAATTKLPQGVPMPGVRPLIVLRTPTWCTWTASGNSASATAGTAAGWSGP